MSINTALIAKACCSSLHLKQNGLCPYASLCLIPQHALSPSSKGLCHLPGNGTHLLVLHKMLIHKMADTQANGQVEGEECVRHWLAPQFLGDCLLVEDLAQRTMNNEHWERNGAQGGHGFASEELGDSRWLGSQCISVHGSQELGEQWHKQHTTCTQIEVREGCRKSTKAHPLRRP